MNSIGPDLPAAEPQTERAGRLPGHATRPAIGSLLAEGRELVLLGRYRLAYATYMRAAQLAHEAGDLALEARSQALLAYAAASLGHNEEAIETGMLASQLAEASADEPTRQLVLNYLGVALLWNGSHEGAEAVLAQNYESTRRPGYRSGMFWQPQINRGFNEAYRQFTLRHLERRRPDARRLVALLNGLDEHAAAQNGCPTSPATPMYAGLLAWLRALALVWQGGAAIAPPQASAPGASSALALALRGCREAMARQPDAPLLQVLMHWLECEQAQAQQQWGLALRAAQQMRTLCERIEQQPLLRVALLLSSDVHEAQGQSLEALNCLRRLQWREQQIRQVSMQHRRDVAALRFELRQRKLEVQTLRTSAQQLQRLSMEDALTGLANRRGLELQIEAALAARQPPEGMALYLSVVDVDRFKAVNDRHSHRVGDQVLKALAELFQQLLRGQDIAGRWGGDEFVLAFWARDDAHAAAITERLRQAVLDHPWELLAQGLTVSVSLGLTRAHPEDCLDSLLLRSDLSMYSDKRSQPGSRLVM